LLCEIKKLRERGGHSPRWAAEPEKLNNNNNNNNKAYQQSMNE
jgi:hypothetical protein